MKVGDLQFTVTSYPLSVPLLPPPLLCLVLIFLHRSLAGRISFLVSEGHQGDLGQSKSMFLREGKGHSSVKEHGDLHSDLQNRISDDDGGDDGDDDDDIHRKEESEIRSNTSLLRPHSELDLELHDFQSTDLGAIKLETNDKRNRDLEETVVLHNRNSADSNIKPTNDLQTNDLQTNDLQTNDLQTNVLKQTTAVTPNTSRVNGTDRYAYSRQFVSLERMRLPPATRDVLIAKRHRTNVTRYRILRVGVGVANGNLDSDDDVRLPSGVNLMIIPLGAIFVFIVLGLLHISRWCIEDIREADGILAKRYHGSSGFVSSLVPSPRPQLQQQQPRLSHPDFTDERLVVVSVGGRSSSTDLTPRIHGRNSRNPRQTRLILPARSTRSLNGLRDRNCDRANRKLAVGSDSSIQMTDMTSRSGRHGDRLRSNNNSDGIVESCKRAVGSFLQSHVIVVPVATGTSGPAAGSRTRTRNYSSPASSSKTGSCCSENRPLLTRGSSSSDGRMTSSDSNIDVISPMSARRRLAAETRYRTKPACVTSAGNLANRIIAFHRHPVGTGSRISAGYSHQMSAPAVSKLVHESLNLSFRFFQVPLSSDPSSGKESLDSVFVCGIYADDSSTAATPAGNDVTLKPEVDFHDAAAEVVVPTSERYSRQPRLSKEMEFCNSGYDRQGSIDETKEEEEEQEMAGSSGGIFAPDVRHRSSCKPSDDPLAVTREKNVSGAILRRCKSSDELQTRGDRKDRKTGNRSTT